MTVDARREQLLAIAGEHFASHPYADVHVQRIADDAGVSLGLIYHHFGDKQGLFAAAVDKAIEELGQATAPDNTLEPLDRIRATLDGYLDYVQANEHAYRTMHRGSQSGDERVREALERNTRRQIDRLCDGLLGDTEAPPLLRLAFRGWLGQVIATCLDWLDNHQASRDEVRTMLLHALQGTVAGVFATVEPDINATVDQAGQIFPPG